MNRSPAPSPGSAPRGTARGTAAGFAGSPIGKSLGLDNDEVALFGKLFGELAASLGIDGGPIFDRLAAGQSIGQALALPDDVIERIYARAHRLFTLGKLDRATALFRALCLLREEDADFWVGYGVCLRLTDQLARARQAFESGVNLRPDWAVPHFHLLELALHLRQWPQAQAALAAYDARAGGGVAPEIAAESARLRVVLERALSGERGNAYGGMAASPRQPRSGP